MSKSDFICAMCKQVKSANLFGTGKYKCPTHKFICGEHVFGAFLPKCKVCGGRVLKYMVSRTSGTWRKA